MVDEIERASDPMSDLTQALDAWTVQGRPDPLEHWLAQELDDEGAPTRLPLADWTAALEGCASAKSAREDWPTAFDENLAGFVRARLRFSRPDGGAATIQEPTSEPRKFWKRIARAFPHPDVARVLSWWFPNQDAEPAPPPMPAWSSPDQALGVLRADWSTRGEFLAFDQRLPSAATRLELFGAGVRWLGPEWRTPGPKDAAAPADTTALPRTWETNSAADVAEWMFRVGDAQITRTALMLRGRRLALLGDQIDGLTPGQAWETRLTVPDEVAVETPSAAGAWTLRTSKQGKSASVVPIGEPPPSTFDRPRLEFHPESREFSLFRVSPGERAWLPFLISWDHARNRKPLTWSVLTVAERGMPCPPDAAWAARASWGRGETLVVYRSLGVPARRTFLGYSTTARFLLAEFTAEGDVKPIVTLA